MALNNYAYDKWDGVLDEVIGDALVATTDKDAYLWYPEYRWMFNKIELCHRQKIPAFPHGIEPKTYPVFSKPITNLEGLSHGTSIWHSQYQYKTDGYNAGHFWMPYLQGQQLSVDLIVNNGVIDWCYFMEPEMDERGSFKCWETADWVHPTLYPKLADWCKEHFSDYRGPVNMETMGSKIIECVPRMGAQFIDFYGTSWLERLVQFCTTPSKKTFFAPHRKKGVSWIVRAASHDSYKVPKIVDVEALKQIEKNWSHSIYLPWYEGQPLDAVVDDPYSYRLAVINAETRSRAKRAEQMLREHAIELSWRH